MHRNFNDRTEPRGLLNAMFTKGRRMTKPGQPLPLRRIPRSELFEDRAQPAVYRLGHSTVLIRLDGQYFLTDPVFSESASPLRWPTPEAETGAAPHAPGSALPCRSVLG